MLGMQAEPGAISGFVLSTVDDPQPKENEALVLTKAMSLNLGEMVSPLHAMGGISGVVPGWDAAGIICKRAADGSGPNEGTRVLTHGTSGAWAEYRAVTSDNLAVIPEQVSFVDAAAIATVGLSSLRSLWRCGSVLGRRLLITGAGGGVGRIAVQLGKRSGAQVVAVSSRPSSRQQLRKLGADEVKKRIDDVKEPVHAVIESVGGETLQKAFGLLGQNGILVSVGSASGEPTVLPPYATVGHERSLVTFENEFVRPGETTGEYMAYLLELIALKKMESSVDWIGPWTEIDEASAALRERRVAGKIVLTTH